MEKPLFRASELLDMAVQIEHAGLSFYESFRQNRAGPRMGALMDYLIEQEHRHVEVFSNMKEAVEHYRPLESYPGEIREYMDSFVEDRVFSGPDRAAEEASRIADPFEAIELAMSFEKRSVDFYQEMKKIIRSSERETVDRIISEEQNHMRRLTAFRQEMEAGNG